MKKDSFNTKLREHVKQNISPTSVDKKFVTIIYDSFKTVLNQSCIQIGSYSRFTAIRPLHDLDILYIIGNWSKEDHNPGKALKELDIIIKNDYKNPTDYELEISLRSHSINILFKSKTEEVFSVDIVPAYIFSKNEYDEDTYKVPEIIRKKHGRNRIEYYGILLEEQRAMVWISTDPRGYLEIAKRVNQSNDDFRKTVKFIKAWKNSCKAKDNSLELKSFHIEQVVTGYFREDPHLEIFDGIFKFFASLPEIIESARIPDRSSNENLIDDYVNNLTKGQKERIIEARDCFLVKLEEFSENDEAGGLLNACFYKRASYHEQFLFDFQIPTLLDDDYSFGIFGEVQERKGGFRKYILDKIGRIKIDRNIKFGIKGNPPNVDLFKWKVKNDNSCKEPRGEITDHHTKNDPELSKYNGNHYVECYAILNNTCVAKSRQNVRLGT